MTLSPRLVSCFRTSGRFFGIEEARHRETIVSGLPLTRYTVEQEVVDDDDDDYEEKDEGEDKDRGGRKSKVADRKRSEVNS